MQKDINIEKFDGKLDGVEWTAKLEKVWEGLTTGILKGTRVYLGDMKQYFFPKQPYVFTVEEVSWQQAESMFGKWDMWKYVPKQIVRTTEANAQTSLFDHTWMLSNVKKGRAEIVRYESVTDNELQILVNGQPMLPLGFPLPWKYDGYSIIQQNFQMIHTEFALGKSFVWRLRTNTKLLDEVAKALVTDVQRIGEPPRGNMAGRVVPQNVFLPGKLTIDLNPSLLPPLIEPTALATAIKGELEVARFLSETLDANSVNPTFTGQKAQGDPTATEIIELQRQAKMVLGLTVFACALLEKKLAQLGLNILLEHWFQPIGTEFDTVREAIKNKYRIATVNRFVEDEGFGTFQVVPTESENRFPVLKDNQMEESRKVYDEEEGSQKPLRRMYLNVTDFKAAKIIWKTIVNPTEQRSSERSKLMFERMLFSAMKLFGPQSVNMPYAQTRYAETWQENPQKLFNQQLPMASIMNQGLPAGVMAQGMNIGAGQPRVAPPAGARAVEANTP